MAVNLIRLRDRSCVFISLSVVLLALLSSSANAHFGLNHHNQAAAARIYAERDAAKFSPSILTPILEAQLQADKGVPATSQRLKFARHSRELNEVIVTSPSDTAQFKVYFTDCACAHCQDCCPCGSGSVTHCSIGHSGLIPANLNIGCGVSHASVFRCFDQVLNGLKNPPELKPPRS